MKTWKSYNVPQKQTDVKGFIKSPKIGAIYGLYGHDVVSFQTSHKLDHIVTSVWEKERFFCEILRTYFCQQKLSLEDITLKCGGQKF